MSVRITIERILRDDDDASGQTIRQWRIDAEGGHITLRDREDHIPFVMLRPADVDVLVADLRRAQTAATQLVSATAQSDGGGAG